MAGQTTYDGYVRVSQTAGREGDSFISPAVQREKVEAWAGLHDIGLGQVFEELDVSGGTMQRPELDKALARIASRASGGLIVAKLDRFGRNAAEADAAIKRIESVGGEVVSVAESFDTRTPIGKAMRRIMLVFAEMELDQRKEEWLVAKRRAVERGVKPGVTPVGYTRQPTGKTTRRGAQEMGPLVKHESDATHIHHAFELSAGEGLEAAQAYLRDVFPDRQMTITVVEKILANRIYRGELRHGDVMLHFPELEVVDAITFALAQHAPRQRERRTKLLPAFPLVHIATCGSCGGPLTAQDAQDGRAYRCRSRDCVDRVHVTAGPLEVMVLDAVKANPPSASTEEMLQRSARVLVASSALDTHLAVTPTPGAEDWLRRAWRDREAELREELAVVHQAADLPYQVELPDLDGELTPAELRMVFERAVERLVVAKGRGPLAERVDLELRK